VRCRTGLIADVVTGKLDVRGVSLPNLDAADEPDVADEQNADDEPDAEEANV